MHSQRQQTEMERTAFEVVQTRAFAAKVERLGLTSDDLREIETITVSDPTAFPIMQGTGGLRKMRFSPASRNVGRSGGVRVCYVFIELAGQIWLIILFAKKRKAQPQRRG
jgi:hypothetical protein